MQTMQEHYVDKSTWGDGPWQTEPDKLQWQDGLPCLIVRSETTGSLCGYVGVPSTHKYYGKNYDDVDVSVHGGLSFSDRCHPGGKICHTVEAGEDDNVWWLGFDCGHSRDLNPAMDARLKQIDPYFATKEAALLPAEYRDVYRNLAYVKAEVAKLAKQLTAPQ